MGTATRRDVARTRRILIVEDDVDIREALVEILNDEGYLALGAKDGIDALATLTHAPAPDIIILDLTMPRMCGCKFRVEQLKNADWAPIPVVVLSADHAGELKAREIGAAAYLAKPVGIDQLLALVGQFL